jgi:hypothetical protein
MLLHGRKGQRVVVWSGKDFVPYRRRGLYEAMVEYHGTHTYRVRVVADGEIWWVAPEQCWPLQEGLALALLGGPEEAS